MTDRFQAAVQTVLRHEGGFAQNPKDPGGATNWGISIRYLLAEKPQWFTGITLDVDHDGDIDADDIRAMPRDTAIEIYRRCWWDRFRYDQLPLGLGEKVFDSSVNMGPSQAHKILQATLNDFAATPLVIDGVLGPKTFATAASLGNNPLVERYRQHQADFYRDLAASHPNLFGFLNGWLRRAAE